MRKTTKLIAAAAAVAIGVPGLATASRSSASGETLRTMKFALAFHDVEIDLGARGPSLGDERIFADSVLDAKGRKVGHDAGVCTFTSLAPPEAVCEITFFLSADEISTQYLNPPPLPSPAAILCGTGAYLGPPGQAVSGEGPQQSASVTAP